MKNLSLKCPHLLVVCVLTMFGLHTSLLAQQTTVRGRVVSANDQPIAGATIAVRGGAGSTSSDAQGRFTLSVPGPAAVLVVSRVGYATGEVSLNGRTDVVVKLTDQAVQLDELVVVG
ncbi:MAG: carboxypeptidase-like regulatory domain-containing protein, partial [Gemmatimonadota bacterium]|nr:carboxypeptidase-like regulatory domain-containing protein [Gemmatimonadota bacterium]